MSGYATVVLPGGDVELRCVSVNDSLGLLPARAELEAPYTGGEQGFPEFVEIYTEGGRVFYGRLSATEVEHRNEQPCARAIYEDARSLLATALGSARMRLREGAILADPDSAVVNPQGEGNMERGGDGSPLFTMFDIGGEPWSAYDALEYIDRWSFGDGPIGGAITLDLDSDPVAVGLLKSYRPTGLDLGRSSVIASLLSVTKPLGVEWSLDFSILPPVLRPIALPAVDEVLSLDAGTPGSQLIPENLPDVIEFRAASPLEHQPARVTVKGLTPQVELTLFLGRKYGPDGGPAPCGLYEGDLIPDWNPAEEGEYEWLYFTDPTASNAALNGRRAAVRHVYRRYAVASTVDLRGFHPSLGSPSRVVVSPCFSLRALGLKGDPELVMLEMIGRWTLPHDRYGRMIGVSWKDHGATVLLDSPVATRISNDPSVLTVMGLGWSVCLTAVADLPISLDREECSFLSDCSSSGSVVLDARGAWARKRAPEFIRLRERLPNTQERDDSASLLSLAEGRFRAAANARFSAKLPGVRADLAPGVLVNEITFDRGIGGTLRMPLPLNVTIRTRRLTANGETEVIA
jgi:hypothetical protein